jgi:hypothetical protein
VPKSGATARRLLAAAGLLTVAIAAPAFSQPSHTAPANVSGAWSFQTQTYGDGCRMFGKMTIRPDASGRHVCTFSTEEHCPDIVARAQESCTAQRNGAALSIKSTVLSVSPKVGYDPDDFDLKIDSSSYMTGQMKSFHSAPVEFFRGDAPNS